MSSPAGPARSSAVVLMVVGMLAVVGFMVGASPRPAPRTPRATASAPADGRPGAAPSYANLRGGRRGPNQDMYVGAVAALAPRIDPLAPVVKTDADWSRAIDLRTQRRAFAGAPPTIPHPITQQSARACLACHEDGARIGDRVAPRMAHEPHGSCTQCHVTSGEALAWTGPSGGVTTAVGTGSAFTGLATFGRGERAHAGAPPTIPHPTLLRPRCETCHGASGPLGLRTPHLFQQSCTQCHTPSALLDQRGPIAAGAAR